MADVDPLLPVMMRSLAANNEARARLIATHAAQYRRDPEGFEAYARQMIEWAQAEAVAKDRASPSDVPQIVQERVPMHRLAAPKS